MLCIVLSAIAIMTSQFLPVQAKDDESDYYLNDKYLRNCDDVFNSGSARNGLYDLFTGERQLTAFCQFNDPDTQSHWMIIQRRNNGKVNFYKTFDKYRSGFGDLWKEFWLGLDNLQAVTSSASYRLRIEMEDHYGRKSHADYGTFEVGKAQDNYPLHIGEFLGGKAGDSLTNHNNCSFSTYDRDNDLWLGNCALVRGGGWWYKRCCYSNLNGRYFRNGRIDFAGMMWYSWKKRAEALKGVVMKIQPNKLTSQGMVLK